MLNFIYQVTKNNYKFINIFLIQEREIFLMGEMGTIMRNRNSDKIDYKYLGLVERIKIRNAPDIKKVVK